MKKRSLVLLTVVALVVVMLAPVALAITKQCWASPCYGTRNDDTLYEHPTFNNKIYALRGDDIIRPALWRIRPTPDTDFLRGGPGKDRLESNDLDGRDVLYGGRGRDVCIVNRGDSTRGCEKVGR